jgi:hypothetical protein
VAASCPLFGKDECAESVAGAVAVVKEILQREPG